MTFSVPLSENRTARFGDYLRIARLDHATKHVFVIPGILLAVLLRGAHADNLLLNVVLGFLSVTAVASANYVINEWLDRESDAFHPEKSQRAAVQRELVPGIVLLEYAVLLITGLMLAGFVNPTFLVVAVLFAVSGVIYNVHPIRTKDRVFIDVLSESINNPIRLTAGWAMVDGSTLPPSSLLLAFWFGGAFLMNSKRLAEYRDIVASDGEEILGRYRRSFRFYTENKLSVANLVYALLCSFFIAIFLIKYRIEYILLFPCIVGLFGVYYALSLKPGSVARKPEVLYRSKPLLAMTALATLVFFVTTIVDMPVFDELTDQRYILIWEE